MLNSCEAKTNAKFDYAFQIFKFTFKYTWLKKPTCTLLKNDQKQHKNLAVVTA